MNIYNDCPGYETFHHYPTTFHNNSIPNEYETLHNNFAAIGEPHYEPSTDSMSPINPITPARPRTSGRGLYPGMPGDFITPHSQQPHNYRYADNGMSLQQTSMPPMVPMMFGNLSSDLPTPEQAAPSHGITTYNGHNYSFSDSSDHSGTVDSPTPRTHGLPTPATSFTGDAIQTYGYVMPTPDTDSTDSTGEAPQSNGQPMATVPLSNLLFNHFSEAEAAASGRTPLSVRNDDWQSIEADKKVHVAAILAAFEGPFRKEPNVAIGATEKIRWIKYQTEQSDKVSKYLAKNQNAKEISAWLLLEALLDTHKLGYKKGLRVSDPDRCCSVRFAQMVRAIGNYAVIRFDLVRMLRFDDLATSPAHVVSRKVANWRGNAGKVKRDELNKEVAAAAGVEYKTVLGNKRQYKPLEQVINDTNLDNSGMNSPSSCKRSSSLKREFDDVDVDDDFTPSATPSKKGGRKTATPAANKRAKRTTVVAGPDAGI